MVTATFARGLVARPTDVRLMCDEGAAAVRAGKADALRFELFNADEAREVRRIMDTEYPDVRYVRNWIAGGPDPRPPC